MISAIPLTTAQIYACSYLVTHIGICILMFFFFSRTLRPRSFVRKPFLSSLPFISILLLYVICIGDHPLPFFKLIFYSTPFIVNFIFYHENIWKHLGNYCFILICFGIVEFLVCSVYFLIVMFFHISVTFSEDSMIPTQPSSQFLLLSFMLLAAQSLTMPLIIRIWKNIIQFIRLKIWIALVLAITLSGSGILFIFPECLGKTGWIIVFIGIFFSVLLFFRGIRQIRLLFHILKRQRDIIHEDRKKYQEIQTKHWELRKQNHDINGHLQTISYLLSEGKIEETQKYIQELLDIL